MPFDTNASMFDRVAALESAVDNGLGDGGANAELDRRLTNFEEAIRLQTVAIADLSRRHADLYAQVQKLAALPKTAA